MCCHSRICPAPADWQDVLRFAGFVPPPDPLRPDYNWMRQVTPEVSIHAFLIDGQLQFALSPHIGSHSAEEHALNAYSAAFLFKILMTLAEGSEAEVWQMDLVGECGAEAQATGRKAHPPGRPGEQSYGIQLAHYPDHPLVFQNLCLGFRQVLERGVPNDRG